MGRRNGRSCLELSSLNDSLSESSASRVSCWSYLEEGKGNGLDDIVVDEVEAQLDRLFEKRGSTREKALEKLAVMFRVDVRLDDCLAHNETLTSRCLTALKKGSGVESSLASQLLGLHVLTLGQPDDRLFLQLQPELERVARNGSGAVAAAAIDSLALAAFVLAEEEQHTRAVMVRLRSLWAKGDPKARCAAVRGWSLLLTSLDAPLTEGEAVAALAALVSLTHDRDLDLRSAAGEAAAVLCDCCSAVLGADMAEDGEEDEQEAEWASEEDGALDGHHLQADDQGDAAGSPSASGQAPGRKPSGSSSGNGGGNGNGTGREELVERMQHLATNKGDKLRRSRRERASQRSTFRGLLGDVSGRGAPRVTRVRLQHGDTLTVEGVVPNHQLDFFRRFLAGGFQAHLQHNALLHDVFGFSPRQERPERLTAQQKRLTRSCQSAEARARSAHRQYNRDAKAAMCGM